MNKAVSMIACYSQFGVYMAAIVVSLLPTCHKFLYYFVFNIYACYWQCKVGGRLSSFTVEVDMTQIYGFLW